MLLDLLRTSPGVFFVIAAVLVFSLAFHELGHAWMADRFGDKTARHLGRITLNPLKHLDPIGTLLLLVAGFGWAKPVPIRPGNFTNYRWGMFAVALAGVAVNFLFAVLALLALAALGVRVTDTGSFAVLPGSQAETLAAGTFDGLLSGLLIAARINMILVVFNLLPIPPLDGSKVVQAFAPASWQRALWGLERYGFLIVIGILLLFNRQVYALIDSVTALLMQLLLR